MDSNIERMEDNEWSFCSLWTEQLNIDGCRVLLNNKLADDYFFNRADITGASGLTAERVEKEFSERGLDCYLYFMHMPPNFSLTDRMCVLKAPSGHIDNYKQVEIIEKKDLPMWIEVFCRSFNAQDWKSEVDRVMNGIFGKVNLLLCYTESDPAGCALLYTINRITGLYCLGTIPELRKAGVATSLLGAACKISKEEHNSDFMFLQTFESYGLLDFYKKKGFEVVYEKAICTTT